MITGIQVQCDKAKCPRTLHWDQGHAGTLKEAVEQCETECGKGCAMEASVKPAEKAKKPAGKKPAAPAAPAAPAVPPAE